MIVRLRSRDGLERVEVDDRASIGGLKLAIKTKLGVALEEMTLSMNKDLLTVKSPDGFDDMANSLASLASVGVSHGAVVYMLCCERQVESAVKKSAFETRPFGAHMSVAQLIAKQMRIERQDDPKCKSVSFDRHAADAFQGYIRSALDFNMKRGGILLGRTDEDAATVTVDVIYEPPQTSTPDSLTLDLSTEEQARVDALAMGLGLKKVGWIFAQSKKSADNDYIISAEELIQMAAMQAECGELGVTAVVSLDEEGGEHGHVHFEAFQTSEQAVKLWQEGWFAKQEGADTSGKLTLTNPKEPDHTAPVIVAGKDTAEVDTDWFLCPVAVNAHVGPLSCNFPLENRLLPQGLPELKAHMRKYARLSYCERLSDFHLLMFLGKQGVLDAGDLALVTQCVATKQNISEGYQMILDGLINAF